jgi:hypothetical protein
VAVVMAIHAAGLNDLKNVKGVRAEPSVLDNGFSLTFSRKGFKCQTFERRDPAADTRVPASRNH